MMGNFIFSFNAVAPSFLLVFLGWALKRAKIIDDRFIDTASKVNFKFGFSTLIFMNIYQSAAITSFDGWYVSYLCGGLLAVCIVLCAIVPRFVKDRRKASAIIHTAFKPNIIVLGYPIAAAMFGSSHMGAISMVLPFVIVLNNVAAVIVLSSFDESNDQYGSRFKNSVIGILKNPIIIASVSAAVLLALRIRLPVFLTKSVSNLSGMAVPLALLTLGAQMELKSVKENLRFSVPATLIKIVAVPIIMVSLAVALGFSGDELAVIFIISGSPTAANSYVISKEMHSDEKLTGEIILMTTLFSMFTLFLGIYILKSFALV